MTTQSTSQYSFAIHLFTHVQHFLYIIGFSILPKDTSACTLGETGIELPTLWLVDDLLFLLYHSCPETMYPSGLNDELVQYNGWQEQVYSVFFKSAQVDFHPLVWETEREREGWLWSQCFSVIHKIVCIHERSWSVVPSCDCERLLL